MNMKQYYADRFRWIFNYRNKNFLYGLAKTLCIVVGLPCYLVSIVVEFALTVVNALFCWIPLLNVAVQVVCKVLVTIVNIPFYWCILPDISAYNVWERAQQGEGEQPTTEQPATEQAVEDLPQQDTAQEEQQ